MHLQLREEHEHLKGSLSSAQERFASVEVRALQAEERAARFRQLSESAERSGAAKNCLLAQLRSRLQEAELKAANLQLLVDGSSQTRGWRAQVTELKDELAEWKGSIRVVAR
ncbi:unnamed protein product [Protopolystoma xenopodis]|uniref:Uncharacterized protein n=1 Tax=Protopolystoma xenopodis TaxID=117903 RepID=A0A448WNB6_9PLAT|nr:unnamed protein product [Protopolystoma xenopodis]